MTAGQEFVKKIGPLGGAIFLLVFIFSLVICFMPPKGGLSDYEPPQTSEYYTQSTVNLAELEAELETNFFPHLGAEVSAELSEGVIIIHADGDDMVLVKAALAEYFSESLFEFVEN